MNYASIYHGSYESLAIEMNKELYEVSGKNYDQYLRKEIDCALAYRQGYSDAKKEIENNEQKT